MLADFGLQPERHHHATSPQIAAQFIAMRVLFNLYITCTQNEFE
jgi:hypothetical protein